MRSSKAAFDLIVAEEVSSRETYTKKYRRPEWPGEQSGATIGIGYDLGQADKATIRKDWGGIVPEGTLTAMLSASGKTGPAGKSATAQIRSSVDIPWDVALGVHEDSVVPRWEAKLEKALPNTDLLSPDCFGALLSLIFNRGPSFNNQGDRYKEMRAIKAHMKAKDFQQIPAEIRGMKRIWPKSAGLRKRRDKEADLFEKGLKANTEPPHDRQSNEIEDVQRRLDNLGYHEVGTIDGKWGGRTAGAIAAFKNDRHISGPAIIDQTLLAEIAKAEGESWARPIAKERADATEKTVEKKAPEIVPVRRGRLAALWATIVSITLGVVNAIADYFHDALSWVISLKEYAADVPGWLWFVLAGGLAAVMYLLARNGANGIVEAFRKGERA
jgi:hypothetical protein